MLATVHQLTRHHAIIQYPGLGIDVAQKQIQCGDALRQAAFNPVPFLSRDQTRQQVVGKDALSTLVAAVDGEGNTLGKKRQIGGLFAPLQLLFRQPRQGLAQIPVGLAHFVECPVKRIISVKRIQFH